MTHKILCPWLDLTLGSPPLPVLPNNYCPKNPETFVLRYIHHVISYLYASLYDLLSACNTTPLSSLPFICLFF